MLATILMIFKIGAILLEISPELYSAFMKIMAAVNTTSEAGNPASVSIVKTSARAILPVLDEKTQLRVNAVLDDYEGYESGAIVYDEKNINDPNAV